MHKKDKQIGHLNVGFRGGRGFTIDELSKLKTGEWFWWINIKSEKGL